MAGRQTPRIEITGSAVVQYESGTAKSMRALAKLEEAGGNYEFDLHSFPESKARIEVSTVMRRPSEAMITLVCR